MLMRKTFAKLFDQEMTSVWKVSKNLKYYSLRTSSTVVKRQHLKIKSVKKVYLAFSLFTIFPL